MNDLIELLKEMGATNIEYEPHTDLTFEDDYLTFEFNGKVAEINGVWYSDETGGLDSNVFDLCPIKQARRVSARNPNAKVQIRELT